MTGKKHINNSLIKTRDNKTQSELKENERLLNVKNVYGVKNIEQIKNKNVLLLDDIFTTGSTANECARVLKEAGAKNVIVMTVAYADKKRKVGF